jgi:hypothetical protein
MTDKMSEPNYAPLTLVEKSTPTWTVHDEDGEPVSRPFLDKAEAEGFALHYLDRHQPCILCGSHDNREGDPLKTLQSGYPTGCAFIHESCLKKLQFWWEKNGAGPPPSMEVIDAAWNEHHEEK